MKMIRIGKWFFYQVKKKNISVGMLDTFPKDYVFVDWGDTLVLLPY